MKPDNRNMILAIVLSVVVLFGWQFFVAGPQLEQAQRRAEIEAQQTNGDQGLATPAADGTIAVPGGNADARVRAWLGRDDAGLRFTLNMLNELAAQKTLDYPTASVAVQRLGQLASQA